MLSKPLAWCVGGWLASLMFAAPLAVTAPRVVTPLPDDWHFIQADPPGAEAREMNDQGWTVVSVPHDWAIAGPFDPPVPGSHKPFIVAAPGH